MEVERWGVENLIDIFTLGGRTSEVDIAAFKEITAGTDIKLCPQFDGHHTNDGYYDAPVEYLRGVFSNWWHQGADSVGVFNWTCAHEETYDKLGLPEMMKSHQQRQMLFEAGSLDKMNGKNKCYAVERKGGYPWAENYLYRNDDKPLPQKITERINPFPLYVYEDISGNTPEKVELVIILSHVSSEDVIKVYVNGFKLHEGYIDSNWKDGQIYGDKPQPAAGPYTCYSIDLNQQLLKLSFDVPAKHIFVGQNQINVVLSECRHSKDEFISVEKTELYVQK